MNKILVVEDNKSMQEMLKSILVEKKYQVKTADDVSSAMLLLKNENFHVIIYCFPAFRNSIKLSPVTIHGHVHSLDYIPKRRCMYHMAFFLILPIYKPCPCLFNKFQKARVFHSIGLSRINYEVHYPGTLEHISKFHIRFVQIRIFTEIVHVAGFSLNS